MQYLFKPINNREYLHITIRHTRAGGSRPRNGAAAIVYYRYIYNGRASAAPIWPYNLERAASSVCVCARLLACLIYHRRRGGSSPVRVRITRVRESCSMSSSSSSIADSGSRNPRGQTVTTSTDRAAMQPPRAPAPPRPTTSSTAAAAAASNSGPTPADDNSVTHVLTYGELSHLHIRCILSSRYKSIFRLCRI